MTSDINQVVAASTIGIGVSRSALEMMASEKPVILSGNQGYFGIFDESKITTSLNTNFCFRGEKRVTYEKLKKDILDLFEKSNEERLKIGQYNRKVVKENYSKDKMVQDYFKLWGIKEDKKSMQIEKSFFGNAQNGEEAYKYALENLNGMKLVVSDFGANILEIHTKDKNGELKDVVLGYDKIEDYFQNSPGFGATVGRNANRIGKAKFNLDGKEFLLEKNDGNNNLHSGFDAFQRRMWKCEKIEEGENPSITFFIHSQDGDQGFPGNLDLRVTYTLTNDNEVKINYNAVSDNDTIVNITNHSYFNLNGQDSGSATAQEVWIDADAFTETDEESIPTGDIVKVENTPMDFRKMKTIEQDINEDYKQLINAGGYDHNYILNNNGKLELVAKMQSKESGITMEVYTDLPGLQLYTGNFLDPNIDIGKNGLKYVKRAGICFETQHFPDAINHENFPSPILKKGEFYNKTTIYKFKVEE